LHRPPAPREPDDPGQARGRPDDARRGRGSARLRSILDAHCFSSGTPQNIEEPLARWLLKTEPGTYSFDDLMREKKTVWSGVKNPTALQHIRSMTKGDAILLYHTGT